MYNKNMATQIKCFLCLIINNNNNNNNNNNRLSIKAKNVKFDI
jgi:hypothetical protein